MPSGFALPVAPHERHSVSRVTVTLAVLPSNASSNVSCRGITTSGARLAPCQPVITAKKKKAASCLHVNRDEFIRDYLVRTLTSLPCHAGADVCSASATDILPTHGAFVQLELLQHALTMRYQSTAHNDEPRIAERCCKTKVQCSQISRPKRRPIAVGSNRCDDRSI